MSGHKDTQSPLSDDRLSVQLTPRPSDQQAERQEYAWATSDHAHNHRILIPALTQLLGEGAGRTLIDLGCGNGSLTEVVAKRGFTTTGIDFASSGIAQALRNRTEVSFVEHDLQTPLPLNLRHRFDVALSAEVIEHMFLPRELFRRADEALTDGGSLIITTPYHGWLKNVALALTNKLEKHWDPTWDYGHIKFFSIPSLTKLAGESGYRITSIVRVGRVPSVAMSMIVTAVKVGRGSP